MHWNSAIAHRFGHSREFLDRFTLGSQRSQRARHLRICRRRMKERAEKIRRFAV